MRRNVIRKPPRKAPTSRVYAKSVDRHYIGDEPIDISVKGYTSALNWYSYTCDSDQAKNWLLDYMMDNEYPTEDIFLIKRVPKKMFPTTIGWIARILSNGNEIENRTFFNNRLNDLLTIGRDEMMAEQGRAVDDGTKKTVIKQDDIALEIEERLDKLGHSFDMHGYLSETNPSVGAVNRIKEIYQRNYQEVMSNDPEVIEAFGDLIDTERKFWQTFMDDCDKFVNGNKKQRKPRKKKVKTSDQLVSKLFYQKECKEFNLVSVDPRELVGAQEAWVFNTKYRKISRYVAEGPGGFSIKGSTLLYFNEPRSVTKIVRKPESFLPRILEGGKIILNKVLEELKTSETPATGRINRDTIIVRVIK